ncbi:hypothetical protein NEPAR06_1001 [Nematocida parisii]|uniref:Uncharacterized protein n=1 Tax=Nematocida parisii (strain ERTm3) TaxID=935791 RepID=I3EFQ6_NEMP3|nr:uncharacterized protein NEPG_01453 [Nematocida parisii ERTm1]EIJ88053.1 hypothetical protein NEQG_01497 [Nematocida parisii ERTm3]KAI5144510.1 hypothetical protein NEPAR07_1104 [Nematocida parisii]EIJ93881.1 hypothetical protein NEPG_01453 [Nematocida parisii ERTm1]KAI5154275.1 hypothetical protein NEPAR06_1001 [Nematocida parisii]KAI5157364.1 hypothetical protein NEPAR05_1212 [Nematocida parisii]|eukprot:XP_013059281.1 hypothetical protein NEPG_01453 [Nematocida parisii ERTm1]
MINCNESVLRERIKKEFINNNKEEIELKGKYKDKVTNIIVDINRNNEIFIDIPVPLRKLAYNMIFIEVFKRTEMGYRYTYNDILTVIKDSINYIGIIMNIIINIAEDLQDNYKKEVFYRVMGNNHMIIAAVYQHRNDFFCDTIDKLCEIHKIKKLDYKLYSDDALIGLFESNKYKKCSRLKRALDILMKYGDNLIIRDNNGNEKSNARKLGISNDDIKSLQLLRRVHQEDVFSIISVVYDSIHIKNKNWNETVSIFWLYLFMLKLSIFMDIKEDILSHKSTKTVDIIKQYLKNMENVENTLIIKNSNAWNRFKSIENDFKINPEEFKNNVIQDYLKRVKSKMLILNGTVNAKIRKVFKNIMLIILIILMVMGTIFLLYPIEVNRVLTNN